MKLGKLSYTLLAAAVAAIFVVSVLYVTADAGKKYRSSKDSKAWLGVYMQDIDKELAEAFDLKVERGVLVDNVIDDSPADDAGLRSGDVIVKLDGDDIVSSDDLSRIVQGHKPGDKVEVKILRNGREETFAVTLGKNSSYDQAIMLWDDAINFRGVPGSRSIILGDGGGYLGVSTTELSDQLADYFGAKHGVLVTEVEQETPAVEAGIKAGDVITAINGRTVDSPGELRRIIRDHEEGDEVKIDVIRKEQPITLMATLDKAEGIEWHGAFNSGILTVPGLPSIPRLDIMRHFDSEAFRDDMDELRRELKTLQEELQVIKRKLD